MRRESILDDLLVQSISDSDARTWLGYWPGRVAGGAVPVFISKFGDWFLRRPDDGIDKLSVIEGTCSEVASTHQELNSLLKSQAWQREHLFSFEVLQLCERGLVPQRGQCYGFIPHPALSGHINTNHAMPMEIGLWQHICARHFLSAAPDVLKKNNSEEPINHFAS